MDPYLEGEMWQEFHETLASAIRAQVMPLLSPRYVALLAKRSVVCVPALSIKEAQMPSPFPGMDPYLEGEMWQEFHDRLANQLSTQLMPLLSPKYVALLAKRYVVSNPALSVMDLDEPREQVFYPDLHVVETTTPASPTPAGSGATVAAPTTEMVSLPVEEVPLLSLEIRDVAERRLVTIVEILSPVNKYGEGFGEYVQRRSGLLNTKTHLLEIDLLRRGARLPLQGAFPPAAYYVFLSRWQRRPVTQVWAVALRERLPVVPLPLLPPDPDVPLDLQAAVDACFDLVGYERLLNYNASPPPPELSPEDATWVDTTLRGAHLRRTDTTAG
jgi:hypothetical protein